MLRQRIEDVAGRIALRLNPPEPTWKRAIRRATPYVATSGATFAAAYFFDVDRGRGRRARTKDQIVGAMRRTTRRVRRQGRHVASDARGMRERRAHRRPEDAWQDDATLAHKVESEVLGDRAIEKGRLNVNAENGIVILRGAVDTPDDMQRLERRVAAVPGVVGVRSLLHLKNAPAYSKDPSHRASEQATSEVGSQARSF